MNSDPEQILRQFRLPPPSPELRARILSAAREEWNHSAPAFEWRPLRRPLQAVAAALLLLAVGNWANHRLTSPDAVATAQAVPASPWISVEIAGLPAPLHVRSGGGPADPSAVSAALQSRQNQMRELMAPAPAPSPAPSPNGQSHWNRQNCAWVASCC